MICEFIEWLQKHSTKSMSIRSVSLNKSSNCESISVREKQALLYQYVLYK